MVTGGRLRFGIALAAMVMAVAVVPSRADHAWGTYHWASDGLVVLSVGDNVSADWDGYLDDAVSDWNKSSVLALTISDGGTSPRRCKPTSGRIEVCSEAYGNNGWLGVAQIWVSGSHIVQATTKVNDTYFNWPFYDTPEWRLFVICQEIGHAFGLDHQDEDFENANLGSCMDYTDDPAGTGSSLSNEHPNDHDYDQLQDIYDHVDESGGGGSGPGPGNGRGRGAGPAGAAQLPEPAFEQGPGDSPSEWGELVRSNGRFAMFALDVGNGRRIFTFVVWA
jgi:hypothetical protein